MKRRKHEGGQVRKQIAELDRIFKRIYEDDIRGAISHDRFLKLSAEYEAETAGSRYLRTEQERFRQLRRD